MYHHRKIQRQVKDFLLIFYFAQCRYWIIIKIAKTVKKNLIRTHIDPMKCWKEWIEDVLNEHTDNELFLTFFLHAEQRYSLTEFSDIDNRNLVSMIFIGKKIAKYYNFFIYLMWLLSSNESHYILLIFRCVYQYWCVQVFVALITIITIICIHLIHIAITSTTSLFWLLSLNIFCWSKCVQYNKTINNMHSIIQRDIKTKFFNSLPKWWCGYKIFKFFF